MKNILIIGCGLLGSSLLRRISKKKIAKKIFIYEKSKSNIAKIKRLKLPGKIVKSLKEGVNNSDLIIFCTPMSEYKNIILKINDFITSKTLITDIGSSKIETSKIINKFLKKGVNWIQSHPIAGSEVSGPEHGKENLFTDRWCIIIKQKNIKKNNINILTKFWKKIGAKVVVTLSNGKKVVEQLDRADAHPYGARPFKRQNYIQKFLTLTDGILDKKESLRFLKTVQNLKNLKSGELNKLNIQVKRSKIKKNTKKGIF